MNAPAFTGEQSVNQDSGDESHRMPDVVPQRRTEALHTESQHCLKNKSWVSSNFCVTDMYLNNIFCFVILLCSFKVAISPILFYYLTSVLLQVLGDNIEKLSSKSFAVYCITVTDTKNKTRFVMRRSAIKSYQCIIGLSLLIGTRLVLFDRKVFVFFPADTVISSDCIANSKRTGTTIYYYPRSLYSHQAPKMLLFIATVFSWRSIYKYYIVPKHF